MIREDELTVLVKNYLTNMMEDSDFNYGDVLEFGGILRELFTLNSMKLKPHLVVWHMNKWHYFQNFIYEVMEIMGYEHIGSMELSGREFNFECEDTAYDNLFRFKSNKCDYSTTYKVGE